MAAVTLLGSATFTTANGSKAVTATPAIGDLIVLVCAHTGNTSTVAPSDNQGGIYVQAGSSAVKATSADTMQFWVRTQLITAATSTVFTHNPGTTSGGGLAVMKVTGMSRAGTNAVRQTALQSNQSAATTPTPVLGVAALTGNALIGAVFNATATAATMTPRASPAYAEALDVGYGTPTTGLEVMSINSGETGTSIAWGGTSTSIFASFVAELDATLPVLALGSPSAMELPTPAPRPAHRAVASAVPIALLLAAASMPPGVGPQENPRGAAHQVQLRTWTDSGPLRLIAPAEVPDTTTTLRAPLITRIASRSVSQFDLPPNLLGTTLAAAEAGAPFAQTEWPNPRPLQGQIGWINAGPHYGQPAVAAEQDIPPARQAARQDWTSTAFALLVTPTEAVPFAQTDWPLPRGLTYRLGWTNTGAMPFDGGEKPPSPVQDWFVPKAGSAAVGWIGRGPHYGQPVFGVAGPVPRGAAVASPAWSASGPHYGAPPAQIEWATPKGRAWPVALLTWAHSGLRAPAADSIPFGSAGGQQLAPRALRQVWEQSPSLALTAEPAEDAPFVQTDWPVPAGRAPYGVGWTHATAPGLIPAFYGFSDQHASWLESLARLHGLIDPLTVSATQRTDGTVDQTVSVAGGTVTITTTAAPIVSTGDGQFTSVHAALLEKLARVHGLVAPLEVTESSRGDGTLQQTISEAAGVTTITSVP